MKIFKKLKKLYKSKFTLMIIPHNSNKTKQLKLNKLLVYSLITITTFTSIFLISATTYLYNANTYLNHDLQVKKDEIKNLYIINNQQKNEIESLKNTSKFVIDKLAQLYDLENQVRNMVGLKSPSKPEENIVLASRSYDRIDGTLLNTEENIDVLDFSSDESVDAISELIDKEKDRFDKLINDVEKQLKYLESKPDFWPVKGTITSKFGYRRHPISRRFHFHRGLDIANKSGTKIVAAGSGIVTYSGWNGGYGRIIIISHGYGYKSVYAHNKKNLVKVGEKVKKGQVIAELGNTGKSTGPHLHFEIHFNGNQIDPLKILKNK